MRTLPNRIAACICFLTPQDAAAGMQILTSLGYRAIVLPEMIDECSDDTTFVEASKPLPEDADKELINNTAFDEIQDAIDHLGDVCEAGLAGDEKIDWCKVGGA